MRTDPKRQHALYNLISVREAAKMLGVTEDYVLTLGRAGKLRVKDFRVPGASRGVYRVDPDSVRECIEGSDIASEAA